MFDLAKEPLRAGYAHLGLQLRPETVGGVTVQTSSSPVEPVQPLVCSSPLVEKRIERKKGPLPCLETQGRLPRPA